MSSPLTDVVAQQYERWVYPQPIDDLEAAAKMGRSLMDPSVHHLAFWPDRDYPEGMDILVAGCGAYEAAMLAFHNPTAKVFGIDISSASLAHETALKKKHKLGNLELIRCPIENAAMLGRSFDLITAGGVLHHMASPLDGLRSLAALLKPEGAIAIMLYAKHGRVGVEMLRSLFQMLGLKQDAPSIALVRNVLQNLPQNHPAAEARSMANDVTYDAGIVDLFLHQRERSYSVAECIGLVQEAGLAFQGWINNAPYYPESTFAPSLPVYAAINARPEREIWAAMELVHAVANVRHHFVACRADRDLSKTAIDFSGNAFLRYVPVLAYGSALQRSGSATAIQKGGQTISLGGPAAEAAALIDGRRSIGSIMQSVSHAADKAAFARQFFGSLWRLSVIRVRIPDQAR